MQFLTWKNKHYSHKFLNEEWSLQSPTILGFRRTQYTPYIRCEKRKRITSRNYRFPSSRKPETHHHHQTGAPAPNPWENLRPPLPPAEEPRNPPKTPAENENPPTPQPFLPNATGKSGGGGGGGRGTPQTREWVCRKATRTRPSGAAPRPLLPRGLNYSAAPARDNCTAGRGPARFHGISLVWGSGNCLRARASTVSSGWGWLTRPWGGEGEERSGRGERRAWIERRTCGSPDWVWREGSGDGWVGLPSAERRWGRQHRRHGSTLSLRAFMSTCCSACLHVVWE